MTTCQVVGTATSLLVTENKKGVILGMLGYLEG